GQAPGIESHGREQGRILANTFPRSGAKSAGSAKNLSWRAIFRLCAGQVKRAAAEFWHLGLRLAGSRQPVIPDAVSSFLLTHIIPLRRQRAHCTRGNPESPMKGPHEAGVVSETECLRYVRDVPSLVCGIDESLAYVAQASFPYIGFKTAKRLEEVVEL